MWNEFYDPTTSYYCETLDLDSSNSCGSVGSVYNAFVCTAVPWLTHFLQKKPILSNALYSIQAIGLGLISQCVFAEMGMVARDKAEQNVNQILAALDAWPRASKHGYFASTASVQESTPTFSDDFGTLENAYRKKTI